LWLHSFKVAQLLRSAACLHTNQSRSYLNHLVEHRFLLICTVFRMLHRPLSVLYLHDQCLSVGYAAAAAAAAAATFPLSNFILLNMHLMATRTPFLKRALNSLGLSVDVVNPGLSQ